MKYLLLCICFSLCLPNTNFAQKVRGSGNVVEQDRSLSGFDQVYVEDGVDVHIKQGTTESVIVKADDNLVDYIKTEVNNGRLTVSTSAHFSYQTRSLDVYVTVKNLKIVKARHGSDVYGIATIKSDDLLIECKEGSDIEMEIQANNLECHVRGGSDAKLSGKVKTLIASARGGSDLMAKKLDTYKCEVNAHGGSDAWVRVEHELDVKAFGASDIHYYGDPQIVHSKARGESDIYGN